MIKVENLVYRYDMDKAPVLRDLSLEIRAGEYVAIVGSNGCGKTTLLKHMNGLLRPSRGNVWVEDINTRDPAMVQQVRQRVGMLFQNPENQIFGMSVEEDVAFGPGNLCLPPAEIRERVVRSLEAVGMMEYAKRAPHTLSGGEKQLVALAGVLAMNPRYIALDEPTTYLDPANRKKILEVIRRLHAQGITIIHVTQDMDEIVAAGRVFVLKEGQIILCEAPSNFFTRIDWMKEMGLGIPKISELIWQLKKIGVDLRQDILTVEEVCHEISALMASKSRRPPS